MLYWGKTFEQAKTWALAHDWKQIQENPVAQAREAVRVETKIDGETVEVDAIILPNGHIEFVTDRGLHCRPPWAWRRIEGKVDPIAVEKMKKFEKWRAEEGGLDRASAAREGAGRTEIVRDKRGYALGEVTALSGGRWHARRYPLATETFSTRQKAINFVLIDAAEPERARENPTAEAPRVKLPRGPRRELWEVIVGNLGAIYRGYAEAAAREAFKNYVDQAIRRESGRAFGTITLMYNGEIVDEADVTGKLKSLPGGGQSSPRPPPGYMRRVKEAHEDFFTDVDATVQGAKRYGATHFGGGKLPMLYTPSGRGYIVRKAYMRAGYYHWPESGQIINELPSTAQPMENLVSWLPRRGEEEAPSRKELHKASFHLVYLPVNMAWAIFMGKDPNPSTWTGPIAGPASYEEMKAKWDEMWSGQDPNAWGANEPEPARDDDEVERIITGQVPMFRGARAPGPIKGPTYFASMKNFAKTYGPTTEVRLHLERPLIVSQDEWKDVEHGFLTFDRPALASVGLLLTAEMVVENLKARGDYDSAFAKFGNMWVAFVVDGKKATAARARENPIAHEAAEQSAPSGEVADAVPWVKLERDPAAYAEQMAHAKAVGQITGARAVYDLLHDALSKEDQEVFCVVAVDIKGQCRGVTEVHRGARSRVSVDVPEILRVANALGGEMFIVVHNHPTTHATPSAADKSLTKAIEKAAKASEQVMMDHVVIGMGEYFSFAENKLTKASGRETRTAPRREEAPHEASEEPVATIQPGDRPGEEPDIEFIVAPVGPIPKWLTLVTGLAWADRVVVRVRLDDIESILREDGVRTYPGETEDEVCAREAKYFLDIFRGEALADSGEPSTLRAWDVYAHAVKYFRGSRFARFGGRSKKYGVFAGLFLNHKETVRDLLQAITIVEQDTYSTVWLYNLEKMKPERVLTLWELIQPTGSAGSTPEPHWDVRTYERDGGISFRDEKGKTLWPLSERQWEEGEWPSESVGGPPAARYGMEAE